MKKKVAVLFLVTVFAVILSFATTSADFIYTGIEDTVVSSPKGIAPREIGGTMYVPLEVFTDYFGVGHSFENASSYTLLMVKNNRFLAFNIDINMVVDHNNYMRRAAVYKAGTTYLVPARFVAEFFGITYSYIRTGSVVRFCSSNSSLSDTAFLNANFAPDEVSSAPPKANNSSNSGDNSIEVPPNRKAYLTFDDAPNEATAKILDTLKRFNVGATFFLTEKGIKQYPDLVMRIIAEGHSIGLNGKEYSSSSFSSPQSMISALDDCNETLARVAKVQTRIVRVPGGSKSVLNDELLYTLSKQGMRLWDYNIAPSGNRSGTIYSNTLNSLKNRKSVSVIKLKSNSSAAEALDDILRYMVKENYSFRIIWVNSTPINRWGYTK